MAVSFRPYRILNMKREWDRNKERSPQKISEKGALRWKPANRKG